MRMEPGNVRADSHALHITLTSPHLYDSFVVIPRKTSERWYPRKQRRTKAMLAVRMSTQTVVTSV